MMSIKKLFCWLFAICLACHGVVQAQMLPLGTYTSSVSSQITFDVDQYGLLSATGVFGGSGSLSLTPSTGSQMFWYPQKAAFRAGYAYSTDWSDSNIGQYSVAFGYATTASGEYSIAMGGNATANNFNSTALGYNVTASGEYSTALGGWTSASFYFSTAMGWVTSASGPVSTAMGSYTSASGYYSTATGCETSANSYDSFVIGQYNVGKSETNGTPNTGVWVSTPGQADPLLEVGNGTGTGSSASDALVVYKDGTSKFQGTITASAGVLTTPASVAQTDIPMYGN
ncbi:MAG: hypothetical protein LV480_01995 [Methylacidiphilales bacterium]|nr:hypothetical protein [Candidatus Methylacidiphilales bacterium]